MTSRSAVAGLVVAGLLASGCGGEVPRVEAREPRDVLMLVVDTLRADELSCYGGAARTPEICSLAERGARFERAYSASSWTLPSAVAMLTGNHPSEYARAADGGSELPLFRVPDEEPLLGEALAGRGFSLTAFVENALATVSNAFQGFTIHAFAPDSDPAPDAEELRRAEELGIALRDRRYRMLVPALEHLGRADGPRRFTVVWIFDPHLLYEPPEGFAVRPSAQGLPHPPLWYRRLGSKPNRELGILSIKSEGKNLSAEEVAHLRGLYRAELESVDERVGWILDALRRSGREDDTLVVFTSDHGEGFGEHRRFAHGNSYYDEVVRVPWIVAGPGVAEGVVIEEPVSHLDLVPTLAELLGVDGLRADLRGRSRAALLRGGRSGGGSHYLVKATWGDNFEDALVEGDYKLIAEAEKGLELYNLVDDPGETRDLSRRESERASAMYETVERFRRENLTRRERNYADADEATLAETSQETEDKLRALGYIAD